MRILFFLSLKSHPSPCFGCHPHFIYLAICPLCSAVCFLSLPIVFSSFPSLPSFLLPSFLPSPSLPLPLSLPPSLPLLCLSEGCQARGCPCGCEDSHKREFSVHPRAPPTRSPHASCRSLQVPQLTPAFVVIYTFSSCYYLECFRFLTFGSSFSVFHFSFLLFDSPFLSILLSFLFS